MGEDRIRLVEAVRLGCQPERLWGRFQDGELIFAITDNFTWTREPWEDAEAFSDRIVRDLLEQRRAAPRDLPRLAEAVA